MKHEPLIFYRPVCGRKRYGPWQSSRSDAFRLAHRLGLAYGDPRVEIGLGPLTWIEKGERQYARSKTVPIGRL